MQDKAAIVWRGPHSAVRQHTDSLFRPTWRSCLYHQELPS